MKKQQVVHKLEEKKHSVRYDAQKTTAAEDIIVTSIYIVKGALPKPFPNSITLTIEAGG